MHNVELGTFYTLYPVPPVHKQGTFLTANACAGTDKPLANFRTVPMKIEGKKIKVSGMRHPDHQGKLSMTEVLAQLRKSHQVLISLEARDDNGESVRKIWEKYGGIYHLCHVEDFKASKLAQMKKVYQIVADAAKKNQSVVIHCGEGWGRSGTALSALMLSSLLQQTTQKIDTRKTVPVKPSDKKTPVMSTPLVEKAIAEVRKYDKTVNHKNPDSTQGESVEIAPQVQCLDNFQLLQIYARL